MMKDLCQIWKVKLILSRRLQAVSLRNRDWEKKHKTINFEFFPIQFRCLDWRRVYNPKQCDCLTWLNDRFTALRDSVELSALHTWMEWIRTKLAADRRRLLHAVRGLHPSCGAALQQLLNRQHLHRSFNSVLPVRLNYWTRGRQRVTLTHDSRDPSVIDPWPAWPVTHDYSPVTVTVWRLRTLGRGKEVSMRFRFDIVPTPPPRCTLNFVHIS